MQMTTSNTTLHRTTQLLFEFNNQTFTVSAKLSMVGITAFGDTTLRNSFRVTVKTDEAKTIFTFYGSNHDYEQGITELPETDLKQALYCLISDAMAGDQTFEDFCGDFGYDPDSIKAFKIWNACKKQKAKADKLGIKDIYELANFLND